jgi:hypothetical protein
VVRAIVLCALGFGPVVAASTAPAATGSAYAAWTVSGANPSWTGTLAIPATGFPGGTFTSDGSSPTIPSGASAFLGASTPFGAVFGSSANQPYLSLRTAAGNAPSTTTFTFATPTPASGWAFAFGDVDADQVQVSATDATGAPVAVGGLGFQQSFNYCTNVPKPSGCGAGPFTDTPVWNPGTSTLVGNGVDTDGASGWFRPTTAIKTLTFRFSRLAGIPIYQVWFAALTASIGGQVTATDTAGADEPSAGTTVELLHPDDTPVLDASSNPVTTTTAADGSFTFPGVVEAPFHVAVDPPAGSVGAVRILAADAGAGDVTGLVFRLAPIPAAVAPTPVEVVPTFTG